MTEGKISIDKARASFIKANKVPPEALGLNIEFLCNYNNAVDNATREAIRAYESGTLLQDVEVEGIIPMEWNIRSSMSHQYIRCIDKTTVKSRHDFKGGYSQ